MQPIYLDYAATTPVDPRVVVKMQACLTRDGVFGNPASSHVYGKVAQELIENARFQVATLLNADSKEIIWTSGATESTNLALKGAAYLYQRKGKHIVTMKTEHKSVLDVCQSLEKEGYQVTYLTPLSNGLLDIEEFKSALREDTVLASVMHVNNETGIVQDIRKLGEITAARGILFHIDAAQSVGKRPLDISEVPVDLISLCAHKIYGPKGVGALYLRKKPRVRVEALLHGGGHEQGMRSGTLPTHQIVGMGEAFFLAQQERKQDQELVHALRQRFIEGMSVIPNFSINTDLLASVPHILNVQFKNMLADAVLAQLPLIAVSTASACQGKGTEGSYVLRAMGLNDEQIKSSLRFSFGRFVTVSQIDQAVQLIYKLFHYN